MESYHWSKGNKILSNQCKYRLIYVQKCLHGLSSDYYELKESLIRTFHTSYLTIHNNACEFTALEHKFKGWFCTQKPGLNVHFKDFLYTKINPAQIWYDKFNQKALKVKNFLHTQHDFLTFNKHKLHLPNQIWVKKIYFVMIYNK